MLSYIQDFPELIEQVSAIDEEMITYDFLAKQFLKESQHLFRRGLLRDYIEITEETGSISGKMLMTESIPSIVQRKPVVVCEKDDYSANILFNQIMVTTLMTLSQNRHVNEKTRKEAFYFLDQVVGIDAIFLSRKVFLKLRFGKHNVYYKRMLNLARILHELRLLSHNQGDWSLYTVDLSESEMNKLFEKFLFHYYQLEQKDYEVRAEQLRWNLRGNQTLLPSMQTDVTLTDHRENKKVVIDAKFYKNMFQRNYEKDSFHSHNMYQIFTYMMHQPKEADIRGILIYPKNLLEDITEVYEWNERLRLEVYSLDLNASWINIKDRLDEILKGTDTVRSIYNEKLGK